MVGRGSVRAGASGMALPMTSPPPNRFPAAHSMQVRDTPRLQPFQELLRSGLSRDGEQGRGQMKLFQPVRFLSVNMAIREPSPLNKSRTNNSRSIDRLSEEGPVALLSIRDEPFITKLCRRSRGSFSDLVGH